MTASAPVFAGCMRLPTSLWLAALILLAEAASGQTLVRDDRNVASDSPEGWAMRYFAGTTLMTSFGETESLAPWRWSGAVELGAIPHLSEAQQHVGFGGSKREDLNKSPVFGRLRIAFGLPGDWVGEFGYTPPLQLAGSRARNVFAAAIGRRLIERDALTLSMRALGQLGKVDGDITCPGRATGHFDPVTNPFDCRAPSRDAFTADYYGIDATLGWGTGDLKLYGSAGIVRARLDVQVDAFVASTHDRSRITSNGNLRWLTFGARYGFDPRSSFTVEMLYVPLDVRRPPEAPGISDPLWSVRGQFRHAFD
jgi:hypothetical protein